MTSEIKELLSLPDFKVVKDNIALLQVCEQAEQKKFVALDTEFVRVRTFFPKLGLIQLYDGENISLIDPLEITDFTPFIKLLANQNILKILHACSEDLEVFQHYFKQLPSPMIDTQIMANFLKFGNSTGLAKLLQHYFGLEMDKSSSRTDWLARPLSAQQLAYAAADVWYLLPLYQKMQVDLAKVGWESAAQEDSHYLLNKCLKIKDTNYVYFNIPNAWQLESIELMRLQLLAKWRYEEAIKRDKAINFVVKGENLWRVAKENPKHTSQLLAIGLSVSEVRIHGKKILQILDQCKRIDPTDYPPKIERISTDPDYRKILKLLQKALKEITPETLLPEVITSKKFLEHLIKWCWLKNEDSDNLPELLSGWRREFGLQLLEIIKKY
ncbi:ribonuclease D [Bisgaardia hudsonensis]|uniref:Ribonuclease D n=1 Tax=Bisgaardia hudsonensis TaxID=109472 RepID=A0A4R2N159_9PAST|nr:ribonuclease D [Bisgaardia hudsonensis]QLB13168.1 ribonuclease D [Bisgaardia hudsonensis]TCP13258.1 ribonuclease D [Bisgaardia hudsonensis]